MKQHDEHRETGEHEGAAPNAGEPSKRRRPFIEASEDPRVRRLKRKKWIPAAIIASLGLLIAVFIAAQLVPAKPLVVYSSKLYDKTVCPQGQVHVFSDYEIKPGYSLRYLEYESEWTQLGQPTTTQPGGQDVLTGKVVKPIERGKRIAPFARTAPVQTGEWKLITHVTMSYEVWGIPRYDEFTYHTKGVLTVLPLGSKQCLEDN